MTAALMGTLIPMTIIAYWMAIRFPKGIVWSAGIVVLVMVASPALSFVISYVYESYASSATGTAFSMDKFARGLAMGFWMWLFAPVVVWLGRKRRKENDALAWKYK